MLFDDVSHQVLTLEVNSQLENIKLASVNIHSLKRVVSNLLVSLDEPCPSLRRPKKEGILDPVRF